MDETHDLGLGRYLDRNGYRHGFDLFNEHLARVVDICQKHGLEPMIWSDMYFRLGCESRDYYDPATVIPDAVVANIPEDVELVYWDYYHDNKAFYIDWIADKFAGRVCVDLDIDRQRITAQGTPRQIDELVREEVEKIGRKKGGLMMIYGLYPGVPLENVKALMDAMEKYATHYS
jgi:hypothetical protein